MVLSQTLSTFELRCTGPFFFDAKFLLCPVHVFSILACSFLFTIFTFLLLPKVDRNKGWELSLLYSFVHGILLFPAGKIISMTNSMCAAFGSLSGKVLSVD